MLRRLLFCLLVMAATGAPAIAQSLRMDQFPSAAALSDNDITFVEQGGVLPATQVPLSTLKNYLLGTPLTSTGTSGSATGTAVRLDQLGQAATLSDTDILLLQPPTAQTTPCCAITLLGLKNYFFNFAPGTYQISFGSVAIDAATTPVQLAAADATSLTQQWIWDGQRFKNNSTGTYLSDSGTGNAIVSAVGDVWRPSVSASAGTLLDLTSGNYINDNNGALVMGSGPSASILSLKLNGGSTGTFSAPASTNTSIGPVTDACSNGACAGVAASLSTTLGGCNATNGAGNGSFLMTSPDGTVILGGQTGQLVTQEGTWTFGVLNADGVDYTLLLNGVAPPGGGYAAKLQITNGKLYALNSGQGVWYLRQNSGFINAGTTAPIEGTTPAAQTLVVKANTAAGSYPVCAIASGSGYSNSPVGAPFSVTGSGASATITAIQINGLTTASFPAPSSARSSVGPIAATCSNGACASTVVSLSTTLGGCNATNGGGNSNFFVTSPDGTIITGGQSGQLITLEGTWAFGGLNADGIDYTNLLNGVVPAGDGFSYTMQITNGILYSFNKAQGVWYQRQNGTWASVGTTAPVEAATPVPQTFAVNSGVGAASYPVCALATGPGYSNSPLGGPLTITGIQQLQSIAGITQYTSASTFAANTPNAALSPSITVTMNPATPAFAGQLQITAGPSPAVVWGYINSGSGIGSPGSGFTLRVSDSSTAAQTEDFFQATAASITVPWTVPSGGVMGNMVAAAALEAATDTHVQSISQDNLAAGSSVTTAAFPAIATGSGFVGVLNTCCVAGITVTSITDNAVPPNTYSILGATEFDPGCCSDYQTLFARAAIHGNPTTLTFQFSGASGGGNVHGDEYANVLAIDRAASLLWSSSNATAQSTTINRSGNTCGFHLVGTTVDASSLGCGPGTYSDWNAVATQAGTANGSLTLPESATAQ